ncbi:phosphodiester glycosidase family protein [Marinicrinis lubricantis]|uniref:Phosphodiester glycosidase family protein n=1 Tax=Marinicrinis lubricantis TaxID=2086470 RepID=A0ABW1IQ66_9BACL
MMTVKRLNRFMLLATAPFAGVLFWILLMNTQLLLTASDPKPLLSTTLSMQEKADEISVKLEDSEQMALNISQSMQKTIESYERITATVNDLYTTAAAQKDRPVLIYDQRITAKLGQRIGVITSPNIELELYPVKEKNYSGYAMKVHLKSADAMKMVLGKDQFGGSETTLQAVKRYGAIAGVNAGGFADSDGKRYPLSTTVLNGEYVSGFFPTYKDLFFVGINKALELVGGKFESREELDKQEPMFGASFVPILLKNGIQQEIPSKWLTSPKRAARTVIANYKHDRLLFVVVEGNDENGRTGATLPELQNYLSRLGVKDAYNLDGGGSTTLVWNGKVLNTPSDDGNLRPLATHFLFFK